MVKKRGCFKVEIITYIIIAIFGLVAGSFLNVCISRIPEDGSVFYPPSHCPKCNAKLAFYDLIPLLSYLVLRGRCRACKEKISLRYPVVEALTALLFLSMYVRSARFIDFTALSVFASLLIVISFIDMERMVIPDILALTGIGAGLVYSTYRGGIEDSLLGICFGFLFMLALGTGSRYVLKKEALGDGDIKFAVMLGAFLGIERTLLAIAVSSILGSIIGIALILLKRIKREDYIPFAPFLALGAIISIFI